MKRACCICAILIATLVAGCGKTQKDEEAPLSVVDILGSVSDDGFRRATAPRRFSFPEDHGPHQGFRNEWWYFTGNLQGSGGRRFGYELTFFKTALAPRPINRPSRWGATDVYMVHFAVTDVKGGRLHASERFSRGTLGLAGSGGTPLRLFVENWKGVETVASPWSMRLSADAPEYGIDLHVRSLMDPVLNGAGGLSRKGATPGNASYYYSLPRMATEGTIRVGKQLYRVTGLTWFDREWSTSALEKGQTGWDWFSLQLRDGRSLMVYRLRRDDGSIDPFSSGTIVSADGTARTLSRDEVIVHVTEWWTSPRSGRRYPGRWKIMVPRDGVDVDVVPLVSDQELLLSVHYWEGAVALGGGDAGYGYVELTGY